MAQLVNLYSNGLISKRTVLDELQRGGVLDPDLVIDDELDRIEEDKEEKLEDAAIQAEEKLAQEVHRTEEMQKVAPDPAPAPEEKLPAANRKPRTEQQKTAQAAKVDK